MDYASNSSTNAPVRSSRWSACALREHARTIRRIRWTWQLALLATACTLLPGGILLSPVLAQQIRAQLRSQSNPHGTEPLISPLKESDVVSTIGKTAEFDRFETPIVGVVLQKGEV
jgi:hypothetical protein